MKKITLLLMLCLILNYLQAQKNNESNFSEQYKLEVKIPKASQKMLKQNPTFVNSYSVSQAITMSGSQKTATKSVFSEVSISGLENEPFQKTVNELYQQLIELLNKNGIKYTEGNDFLQSDYVKGRIAKSGKTELIGTLGNKTQFEGKKKISEGSIPHYGVFAVTRDVRFFPTDKPVYITSNIIKSGNFYQKASSKNNTNLLSINYYVSFASFDGSRGYKDVSLSTKPVLAIAVAVNLITPNGAINKIYFKKSPVWGSSEWSLGTVKGKDNKDLSEFLGLARSAEYEIKADPTLYLSEMKSLISQLQTEIVQELGVIIK